MNRIMDSDYFWLAMAATAFFFSLISKRVVKWGISPPMVFCFIGLTLSWFKFNVHNTDTMIEFIAKATLVLVLFIDAIQLSWYEVLHNHIARRLLIIGLPLMILFGTVVAYYLFPSISWINAALLSLVLAPTDAALGKQVVTDKRVPQKVREGLATESGLNDGLVLPLLLAVISIAKHNLDQANFFVFLGEQVGLGFLIGILIGLLGRTLMGKSASKSWVLPTYQHLFGISLAALSYLTAEIIGGNGFISCFTTGLVFTLSNRIVQHRVMVFGLSEGEQLSLITFFVFGSAMVPNSFASWDIWGFSYALLSLTVIRMGSVALALIGAKLSFKHILFLGWFGPRGLASILYSILVIGQHLPFSFEYLHGVVMLTVLISIFVHGISAPQFIRHVEELERKIV